jgi:16S rRNA (guanine527-N7)-methyltransferase
MIELLPGLTVSRETYEALKLYIDLLKTWNKRINLVSPATFEHAWERHILDSAQLLFYLPDKQASIMDFGTGAGFPGMVLSLLGYQSVRLIEADKRKCVFLREVIRQTGARATVINGRIEAVNVKTEYIVSRAFTSLLNILFLLDREALPNSTLLALKGRHYQEEIIGAQNFWAFNYEVFPKPS